MAFQKERLDGTCRRRRRKSGLRDDLLDWRWLRRCRTVVKFVVGIKVWREQKCRVIQEAALGLTAEPFTSVYPE